jgi:hypothetical protein
LGLGTVEFVVLEADKNKEEVAIKGILGEYSWLVGGESERPDPPVNVCKYVRRRNWTGWMNDELLSGNLILQSTNSPP